MIERLGLTSWRFAGSHDPAKEFSREKQNPSPLPGMHRTLRVWEFVCDAEHVAENQRRYLQPMPSIFHRQAEVRGHGGTRRTVQQEVRRDLQLSENGACEEVTGHEVTCYGVIVRALGGRGCGALVAGVLLCAAVVGCAQGRPVARAVSTTMWVGLAAPEPVAELSAVCVPPMGWVLSPIKRNNTHVHETWVSPTGRTAYGVIRFNMPLPVGYDLALWGFLEHMKSTEGEAELMSKRWDSDAGFLRFEARGGRYDIRTNMVVRGFDGWAVYAGTLKGQPIDEAELELAERARELTEVDVKVAATKP